VSFAIDANILVYASDSESLLCVPAQSFLAKCAQETEVFYLAWPTVMAYLRISTHSSIFKNPLSPAQALANIQALLDLPHCRLIREGEQCWRDYIELAAEAHPRGNLVPDTHLAALLKSNGIKRLYTRDRDFRRFEFLKVVDPF
jgi:toxin-antitoxin system PIN domain toxin